MSAPDNTIILTELDRAETDAMSETKAKTLETGRASAYSNGLVCLTVLLMRSYKLLDCWWSCTPLYVS
jgi:hypothetical protein